MSHARGQIEEAKDMFKEVFFKVYTGCKFLDDFYTCDSLKQATAISNELKGNEK